MTLKQITVLVLLSATVAGQSVRADDSEEIKTLRSQIESLDQKVRILERKGELDKETAAQQARTIPIVKAGSSGFSITSADTNFSVSLRGYVQFDNRTFFQPTTPGAEGFVLRRVRPVISGTVFRDFEYRILPEFGGSSPSIYDAYLNYRFRPELQLLAGRFKPPVGLERLQSARDLFFTERSLVTDLVPSRDLGVQLHGELLGGVFDYAAGVFNGVGDGANTGNIDFDGNREFAGRIFVQPFKKTQFTALQNLGLGIAGSWGKISSSSSGLPNGNGYSTEGQQRFFSYRSSTFADGDHWRLSPQAYYFYGPFSLMVEYAISDQVVGRTNAPLTRTDLQNTAWEATVGWVVTGEEATFSGVTPRHPFNLKEGGWGALQIVGRYSELDVDKKAFPLYSDPSASANSAQQWGVGLNWYLNKNVRLLTSYSHTEFSGGGKSAASSAPAIVTRQPEDVWFTRLQLSF